MTTVHYAIGDIHGRDDLLEQLHRKIVAHRAQHFADAEAVLVYVGDYIDRGPDSRGVIDRVMAGLDGFRTVALKGNHEDLMMQCLDSDDQTAWWNWLANAGDTTLQSFGIDTGSAAALAEGLGPARIAWLRSLSLYHLAPPYLFVHAGILPGRPIEAQSEHDLLWIRNRFLDSDTDHGFVVVHGHTPSNAPDIRPNRIGIDTGAVVYGVLTAVTLCPDREPEFLSAKENPVF